MSATFTKKHVKRIAEILDGDFESAEAAAQAVLDEAFDIYEERAKWAVVGALCTEWSSQPHTTTEHKEITRVVFGIFGTETQAANHAFKVAGLKPTGEYLHAWALPIWHGTPHEWAKDRKLEWADREQGHTAADAFLHTFYWFQEHPELDWKDPKDRKKYPGMKKRDYICVTCGRPDLTDGHEAVLATMLPPEKLPA